MREDTSHVEEFWSAVSGRLRERLSAQDYCSWFSEASITRLDAHGVELSLINDFAVRWVSQHFGDVVSSCVRDCAGVELSLQLVARTTEQHARPAPPRERREAVSARAGSAMTEAELRAELARDSDEPSRTLTVVDAPLRRRTTGEPAATTNRSAAADQELSGALQPDERYRFDNFVIGRANQMVHAAALAVAETPAQSYNPLFIHGATGIGKTHLLHAIGQYVRHSRPDARVAYISVEQFLSRFVAIVQAAKVSSDGREQRDRFKAFFRDLDVLLMDDVQFVAGRAAWLHEELFHLFNAIHARGGQIVLTSDCSPEQIPQLEDRLRSRFAWGLIARIEAPDQDMRAAILRRKARVEQLPVDDAVITLIAEHAGSNVRELEGAFTRVVADASLRGERVSVELAERVLGELAPGAGEPVTIDRIQRAVCEHYGLTRDELLSERRARAISLPRQIGMYLSRQLANAPSTQVAMRFNRRDHSTILHAEKKISALIAADHQMHDVVAELTRKLRDGHISVGSRR